MSGSMLYPQAKLITLSDPFFEIHNNYHAVKKHCFSVVYGQSQNANANNCKTNQALIATNFRKKNKLSSV